MSWAPSGWYISFTTREINTDFVTLACPDDFYAVRVGFTNINREAFQVTKVIATSSATLGDCANPTGAVDWRPLTFANAGVDRDVIVMADDAPTVITVAGNRGRQNSAAPIASWTWTDWVALASQRRSDQPDSRPALMIRVLYAAGCTNTRPNGGFGEFSGKIKINQGYDYAVGHYPLDEVTNPGRIRPEAAGIGGSTSPVACVQFLTRNAGIVGMTTGDSHHQGSSTSTQFLNYLMRSTVSMAAKNIGRLPFGMTSSAQGGTNSEFFFGNLSALLRQVNPSFVVLPGWTFNDEHGGVRANREANDIFLARLLTAAEECFRIGAVPIFLTPFPRNKIEMTPSRLDAWLQLRRTIQGMAGQNSIVLDATSLLGRSTPAGFDGTYLRGLSDDQMHPNDAGHAAVATELASIIERLRSQH